MRRKTLSPSRASRGVLDDAASGMPLTVRIAGVRQDEPTSGLSAADVGPDAVILGKGNGRVYTIAFTAHDGLAGCSGVVKVEVLHSRNGTAAGDEGPSYDSTEG